MVVKNKYFQYQPYIALATVFLCLIIAIIAESRSVVIGYTVGLLLLWKMHYPGRLKPIYIISVIAAFTVIVWLLVFHVKSDSSEGRIFIYKISFAMLKDHWLYGIGWGKFQQQYGLYQARYFQAGHYTVKELLLADNTFFAFNDYLQFVIELGIAGACAALAAVAIMMILIRKALSRKDTVPPLIQVAAVQIVAIAVAALFTHVFEKEYIQIILATSIIALTAYTFPEAVSRKYALTAWAISILGICAGLIDTYVLDRKANENWQQAIELSRSGYVNQSLVQYQHCYPQLKRHAYFLDSYGAELLNVSQYQRAVEVLNKLTAKQTRNSYYVNLGRCYFATKKYDSAEKAFTIAVNIVPNRFSPRYSLYQFYRETGQRQKAAACKEAILHLPVKIPSKQVTAILQILKNERSR